MAVNIITTGGATTIIPVLGLAMGYLAVALGVSLPELQAQFDIMGELALKAGLVIPQLEAAAFADIGLQLLTTPPSFSVEANAGIKTDIALKITPLQIAAAWMAGINGLSGNIQLSTYEGTKSNFPSESGQTITGAPIDNTFAVVLSANTSADIDTLKSLFTT